MNFDEQMQEIFHEHAAITRAGIEAGERSAIPYKRALQLIVDSYDEKEVIPTKLLLAIQHGKSLL